MKTLEIVRLVYGLLEFLAPRTVTGLLLGHPPDKKTRTVIRILGARHALQAALTFGRPATWHRVGGAVDLIHAATAAAFAKNDPRRRIPASINVALALIFAAGELP
jgi:hypothetical protein